MYTILLSRRFQRSFRNLKTSGTFKTAAVSDFKSIVSALQAGEKIPAIYKDHALTGDMADYRECHIKGDLLLVYQKDERELIINLVDIGSHSHIFG